MLFYELVVDLRNSRRKAIMEKLSKQEEEAMQAVWQCQGGFIKDFLDQLAEPKPPYTTLASTIKNLERKAFLKAKNMAILSGTWPPYRRRNTRSGL